MSDQYGLNSVREELEQLRKELVKIQISQSFEELGEREEKLIQLLEDQEEVRNEIKEQKVKELALKEKIRKYETIVNRAINDREKVITTLHKRISVLEQSLPHYVTNRIRKGLRQPRRLPTEFWNSGKAIGGAVRRKVTRKKKKYNLRKLPYNLTKPPKSILSELGLNDKAERELNELFLVGLYNTPKRLEELRVACILDDFSYQSFKPDAELITFKPDNWFEVFKTKLPHLLFVESAWKGNSGSWQYKIAKYNIDQGPELDDMLKWCKENKVPSVFWNKEDPIHFEKFIDTAKKFDVIFTSDENCIDRYKEVVGHDKVYALPFAAQPKLHNPVKTKGYKSRNICFAGSYYANRHENRKLEQEKLLDAAKDYGLEIYDRNYSKDRTVSQHFRFPERFEPHIKGSLPYEKLVRAYKDYKLFLNVNSVQDSNTMFSRRVFELLACGTTVVSTPSKGVERLFGDVVTMVDMEDDNVAARIESTLNEEQRRKKNELIGMRRIFSEHTYAHRLVNIAEKCGFNLEKPYDPSILMISRVSSEEDVMKIASSFTKQSFSKKKLGLIVSGSINIEQFKPDIVIDEEVLGEQDIQTFLQQENINYDLLGTLSPEAYYGEHFLTDLVQAYIYTEADAVGKSPAESGKENMFVSRLLPGSYLIKRDTLTNFDISISELLTSNSDLSEHVAYGLRLYSSNEYNFSPTSSALTNHDMDLLNI